MNIARKAFSFLILLSISAAGFVLYGLGKLELSNLQEQIAGTGALAPLIYIAIYIIATALILPSTVLNLTGGALFGVVWGTVWTTLAAVMSALIIFWITRSWLQELVQQRLSQDWKHLDREFRDGGPFYLLSLRLLPIIPYGIINYSAGLSSLKFRDYLVGTCLGTVPGLFPFVMLGNTGVKAVTTGQLLPILLPLTLIGLLIGGSTWYKKSGQAKFKK